MSAVACRCQFKSNTMNSLPDEIVRKIADMTIAVNYCSMTVYDMWGVQFWVSRPLSAAPWFCKIAFPDSATATEVTSGGMKPSDAEDMRVGWLPALTLRTKAALQLVVAEKFKEHAFYQHRQNLYYYYSQDDAGVPPQYMARGHTPWMTARHAGGEQIAPVPPFNGFIEEKEYTVWTDTIVDTRVKRIMSVIETLVATM
jgi:hypothetical protein